VIHSTQGTSFPSASQTVRFRSSHSIFCWANHARLWLSNSLGSVEGGGAVSSVLFISVLEALPGVYARPANARMTVLLSGQYHATYAIVFEAINECQI
jgi:hypothetical protein